jgi:adenylyltransferase/sulfurtransferase
MVRRYFTRSNRSNGFGGTGLIGTIQATEALKLILGAGDPLIGRLLLVDALTMQFRTIELRRDPECPACGTRELKELIDYEAFCGVSATGAHSPEDAIYDISPRELSERMRLGDDIQLIDVREEWEWQIAKLPGAKLVPLGRIDEAISSLDPQRDTVLYCKVGVRSLHAAEALADAGFSRLGNLSGGIIRWSEEVDPTIPRY